MWKLFILSLSLLSVLSVPHAGAMDVPQDFLLRMQREHGFQADWLARTFAQARLKQNILKTMSRPGEAKPYYGYLGIFLTSRRIAQGAEFYREQRALLMRAEREYGVDAAVIAAIIGVETGYGRNSGSFRVLDALATLAFHYPKRAAFFSKELEQFLVLCREQGWVPTEPKGSYAGAMGIGQFIPSSYRKWAVDFDRDGHINLWQMADAIGSVAHYLQDHGWRRGGPVVTALAVAPQGEQRDELLAEGGKPTRAWRELQAMGAQLSTPLAATAQVALISLKGPDEQALYWLGFNNFYVITRYNRSWRYAMAVHGLATAIEGARHAR